MANLAVRSFSTLGYIGAALLIALVAVLALASLGDDSSGQQAAGVTATPAPTTVSIGPGGIAEVHELPRALHRQGRRGVREPGLLADCDTTGHDGIKTPDCPLTPD